MSSRSNASSNPILTNFAQGLMQDRTSALAEFLAPSVIVPATIGHYKKFDDKNMYQAVETARAIGGAAKRIEFDAADPTYNCKPQALEIAIDDSERDAAGSTDPILLEQSKASVLVNTAVLSHEDKVLTAIKAGVAAVADQGNWSNKDIDPLDQIDAQIKAIADATGLLPNRMVLGLGALYLLRQNAKVKARLAGVKVSGFGLQDISACLLNPAIDIRTGVLVKDAKKFPVAKAAQNIVGDECFIFYSSPSPSTYDPSFAKTFKGGSGGVDSVRVYRGEPNRSDILALDWSVDVQVVASGMARRLSIS
jgi:hypothetical protein